MLTRAARRRGAPAMWRFRQDGSGTSAVEFAMILPIMLVLIVGGVELAHAIDNWRKVTALARTVADLTSQGDRQNPISASLMSDILAASTLTLRPFAATDARIVVSALSVDPSRSATSPVVCSSAASANAQALVRPLGVAADLSLPAGLGVNGARYVLAEVSMPYTPVLGAALLALAGSGPIALTASFTWPTRGGQAYGGANPEVVLPGGAQCP